MPSARRPAFDAPTSIAYDSFASALYVAESQGVIRQIVLVPGNSVTTLGRRVAAARVTRGRRRRRGAVWWLAGNRPRGSGRRCKE